MLWSHERPRHPTSSRTTVGFASLREMVGAICRMSYDATRSGGLLETGLSFGLILTFQSTGSLLATAERIP